MIKSISLQGFKAFAKKVEIPFSQGFNCILGANGSGKSNITDAICFVLGKGSAKEMRAEKSAKLICNGGKTGNPAKEAIVSIVFDNPKQIFKIQDKEVTLTRIVKQSGNSIYKINNEVKTKQEFMEFLYAANIDPDNYNIVLQGEITKFMEMSPVARMQLIEKISGVSIFEEKKEKAMHELSKVTEKLNQAQLILVEREKVLSELKKDREQALKYKSLEENIIKNKATRLGLLIAQKNSLLEQEIKKIANIEHEVSRLKSAIENLKSIINQKNIEIKNLSQNLDFEKQQEELFKKLDASKSILAILTGRKSICDNEIKKSSDRVPQIKKTISDLEQQINSLKEKKSAFEKQLKNRELHENHGKNDELIALSIKELQEKLEGLESQIEVKQKSLWEYNERYQSISQQASIISANIKSLDDNIEKAKKLHPTSLKEEIETLTLKHKNVETEILKLSGEISKLAKELADKNDRLITLKSKDFMLKEFSSFDRAISKIKSANIEGVYGTLSELGIAEDKYSLALEVAAGARLKSIVVSTDMVAARCIKLLKDTKAGFATFIPLNQLTIKEDTKPTPKSEGVIAKAIELIKFDRKFKPAYEYALGSTLVIDDINTAKKLGIGKYRYVTLEGDLIERMGVMVGGFRAKQPIAFLDPSLQIKALDSEIQNLSKKKSALEKKKSEAESFCFSVKEQLALLQAKLHSSPFNINELTQTKNKLENELSLLQNKLNKIKEENNHLIKDIENLKQDKNKLRVKLSAASQHMESIESANVSIKIRNDIELISRHISLISAEKEKTIVILKDMERGQQTLLNESKELADKIKQEHKISSSLQKDLKNFNAKFQKLFKKNDNLKQSIQKINTKIARFEERILALEENKNDSSIKKAFLAGEVEQLKKEFEPFQGTHMRRGVSLEELNAEIKNYENAMKNMGNINMRALEVYEAVEKEFNELKEKYSKLTLEKEDVLNLINEIEGKKKDTLLKIFKVLSKNFKEIFSMLSDKGEANLIIEDEEHLFESGIDIVVKIGPGRSLDIRSLSGGEKSLAALAFIFAIQEFCPAPFYLLDEVDTALDKKNSEFLSKLLANYSKNSQYIVISHNDSVISEADTVYGISMQDGISKVVSLKL